jgi:hypothetical protein
MSDQSTPAPPVVVDLGGHRRKRVRQLRRGTGKLMDDVNGALDDLRAAGTIAADVQPVVVIVRQKRRRLRSLIPGL